MCQLCRNPPTRHRHRNSITYQAVRDRELITEPNQSRRSRICRPIDESEWDPRDGKWLAEEDRATIQTISQDWGLRDDSIQDLVPGSVRIGHFLTVDQEAKIRYPLFNELDPSIAPFEKM
jgi:hypothetical protein